MQALLANVWMQAEERAAQSINVQRHFYRCFINLGAITMKSKFIFMAKLASLALAFALISNFSLGANMLDKQNKSLVSTGSIYFLSPDEIKQKSASAINGDAEAAFRLYSYYSMSALKPDVAFKWLKLAAAEGHIISQYNLASVFFEKGDLNRALFWAEAAKLRNAPRSDDLIGQINEGMKNKNSFLRCFFRKSN